MSSKDHILFLAPQPFFENRGTPFNVRAMVEVLDREAYAVDLLTYDYGREVELGGVRHFRSCRLPFVSSIPIGFSFKKLLCDIPFFFKACSLLWKNKYSIIHGIEEAGIMASVLSFFSGVQFIYDMDSSMPEQVAKSLFGGAAWAEKAFSKIEALFLKRAAVVLTVCEALSDKALCISSKLNICQIEDFPLEGANLVDDVLRSELREELGLVGKRAAVYTGNFESYQGIDLLLKAFARAKSETGFEDVVLLLVGGGDEKNPKVQKVKELAESLNIADSVRFAGLRPSEQMGTFMALADVLLSPRTVGENTPLKLYSYMAAERAIVATKIRSHTQVLDDSSAFLAEPNAEAYAGKLREAFADNDTSRARRERVIANSKKLIDCKYNREVFGKRLLALYSEIISNEQQRKAVVA